MEDYGNPPKRGMARAVSHREHSRRQAHPCEKVESSYVRAFSDIKDIPFLQRKGKETEVSDFNRRISLPDRLPCCVREGGRSLQELKIINKK